MRPSARSLVDVWISSCPTDRLRRREVPMIIFTLNMWKLKFVLQPKSIWIQTSSRKDGGVSKRFGETGVARPDKGLRDLDSEVAVGGGVKLAPWCRAKVGGSWMSVKFFNYLINRFLETLYYYLPASYLSVAINGAKLEVFQNWTATTAGH